MKLLSDYHKRSDSSDGHHHKCKVCINQEHAKYNASPKGRDRWYRARYGISYQEYMRMWEEQDGCCAICGDFEGNKALAVDHNHETGEVRGLLCQQCNTGIGQLPNPEILMAAAAYLIQAETAVAIP